MVYVSTLLEILAKNDVVHVCFLSADIVSTLLEILADPLRQVVRWRDHV